MQVLCGSLLVQAKEKKEEKKRKEKKKRSTFAIPSQSKTQILSRKLNRGHESQFQAKGASGSLKMDPHPLLMASLPCLFCSRMNSMQRGKMRHVQKVLHPRILFVYLLPPSAPWRGLVGYLCTARDSFPRLPFQLSLT